ncbi:MULTISPECIES: hypothetical protein [Actinopolyspora]|uniref:YGGT family protein n=1 Tax=Actinopolyspora saharensis TaxID=995062 RepID=A0A1H1FCR5_9ACTN|nr:MULTISPECIES: hypothetical protein [Actinopolyspora]NHD19233.1 hypothetical protein [Actinopolyspora sp. BKK2]NHE78357.1 hypothetical protein [Actinopolyspora sp. BKK1]SDQ98680.1 hypothetical protein SAMN04489718_2967 [Actinopolyspora saharensis]
MASNKTNSGSPLGTLFQGLGFLLAVILVAHTVFVLFEFQPEGQLAQSVARAAEPLALFFPGLIDAPAPEAQVLLDYGLAALFWMLVGGVLGRIFG